MIRKIGSVVVNCALQTAAACSTLACLHVLTTRTTVHFSQTPMVLFKIRTETPLKVAILLPFPLSLSVEITSRFSHRTGMWMCRREAGSRSHFLLPFLPHVFFASSQEPLVLQRHSPVDTFRPLFSIGPWCLCHTCCYLSLKAPLLCVAL